MPKGWQMKRREPVTDLRSAEAVGLTISPLPLATADEVIE